MDALASILVDNVLPFLASRDDWNSLSMVSREIHRAATTSPLALPPWPDHECTLVANKTNCYNTYHNPRWSPCGRQIAYVSSSGAHIFDAKKGQLVELYHGAYTTSTAYTPNGNFFVSASQDGRVYLWDVKKDYQLVKKWKVFDVIGAAYVAVSPCGEKVAVLQWKKVIVLGINDDNAAAAADDDDDDDDDDADDAADDDDVLHSLTLEHFVGDCSNLLFSRDGTCLIFCGLLPPLGHVIKVWKPLTNEVVCIMEREGGDTDNCCIEMSPDGSNIITLCGTNAKVWHLNTNRSDEGMLTFSHKIDCGNSRAMAFYPDGETALFGNRGYRSRFQIWKQNGERGYVIKTPRSVDAISFSPDGRKIVTAEDGSIVVKNCFPSVKDFDREKERIQALQERKQRLDRMLDFPGAPAKKRKKTENFLIS